MTRTKRRISYKKVARLLFNIAYFVAMELFLVHLLLGAFTGYGLEMELAKLFG